MEWGNLSVAALAVSIASTCIRWRVPAVPPALATAGIGASLCIALLSLFHPSYALAASLTINAAVFCGLIDFLAFRRKSEKTSAKGAMLRLTFYGDHRHPTVVRSENIATWCAYYNQAARFTGQNLEGEEVTLLEIPRSWAVFLCYESATQVSQIIASLNAPGLPPYNIVVSTTHACVIAFSADIPAGDLEIFVQR